MDQSNHTPETEKLSADIAEKTHDVRDRLFWDVHQEIQKQNAKWGLQDHSFGDWMLCINEELGEMSEAILKGRQDPAWEELTHVVALLCRLGERITRPISHWANPTTTAIASEYQALHPQSGITPADLPASDTKEPASGK